MSNEEILLSEKSLKLIGNNWYPVEKQPDCYFRWVSNDAEFFVEPSLTGKQKLVIEVESGPGLRSEPFTLKVLDDSKKCVAAVSGHKRDKLQLEFQCSIFRRAHYFLHVDGGGALAPNDSRCLNFRVFEFTDQREKSPAIHQWVWRAKKFKSLFTIFTSHFKSWARKLLLRLLLSPLTKLLVELLMTMLGRRQRPQTDKLSALQNIIVIRLDEIGDAVLTSAFLRELRRNCPQTFISLVVKPAVFNLMEKCPYVNEVLEFRETRAEQSLTFRGLRASLAFAARHYLVRKYELAMVPRFDVDYYHATVIAYLSGAHRRVAHSEHSSALKKLLNRDFDKFLTDAFVDVESAHEVELSLELLRKLGGRVQQSNLEIWVDEADELFCEQYLKNFDIPDSCQLIGIGIGAGAPARRWSASKLLHLSKLLLRSYDCRVILVGGKDDNFNGEILSRRTGGLSINTCGKLTLRQTAAIMKKCDLFIGNDSGPMHMAAGAMLPVIEISNFPENGDPRHINSPVRFGPWMVPHRILQPENTLPPCDGACSASDTHCIEQISAEQVFEATKNFLSRNNHSNNTEQPEDSIK